MMYNIMHSAETSDGTVRRCLSLQQVSLPAYTCRAVPNLGL